MTRRLLHVLGLAACLQFGALAQAAEPRPGVATCGFRTFTVEVPGKPSITIAVWYPAEAVETTHLYGTGNRGRIEGRVAFEAPARAGSWPVIVLSHGYSGSGIGQGDVTEALARGGYVVAAPDHSDAVVCTRIGSAGATGTLTEALRFLGSHPIRADGAFAYRIAEIGAVAAAMRTHAEFNPDPQRLILAGHSLGGWTAMSAKLGGLSPHAMVFFSMGELNWLMKGERFFPAEVFRALACPTLYIVGDAETTAAARAGREGAYAAFARRWSPPPSDLAIIPGGDHFVYNTPAVAGDSGGSPAQAAAIATATLRFLDRHLGTIEAGPLPPGDHVRNLVVGGLARRYLLHVPPGYDGRRALPVVLMYHGGGGTAQAAMRETNWTVKADQAGFLAVFPEGSAPDPSRPGRFLDNPQTWNDGSGRFHAGATGRDDIGFTTALLDDLAAICAVDERRIYATGFSNGSSMVYRLGVELATRLAAIAPVASSGLRVPADRLARPVPMITIQGDADRLNPLAGGRIRSFGVVDHRPPVRSSVERWARMCGCPMIPDERHDRDGVTTLVFGPGTDGIEVVMHIVEGMGHTWPGGTSLLPEGLVGKTSGKFAGIDAIWDFFKRFQLPSLTASEAKP